MKLKNIFITRYSLFIKKVFAFTLAETLIVMGIIGVVAALTLPNLNSSTGDKEKVVKLKKIYSNLDEAFSRAKIIYGPFNQWMRNVESLDEASEKIGGRIIEFMKISKACSVGEAGCFNPTLSYAPSYILNDGTSILVDADSGCADSFIKVDIDGPNKGQNTSGKDQFYFAFNMCDDEDITPYGRNYFNDCIKSVFKYCTAWVIDYGNFDYLNVDSNGKCNNNKSIILDGVSNTSCK